MEFLGFIENPTFLMFCYVIVAMALYTYLYTTLVICKRKRCTKKKRILIPTMCKFDCTTENWLISTEAQLSPLNIETQSNQGCNLRKLSWENHEIMPNKMFLENNGETVILYAIFQNRIASVKGADLENQYNFVHITFRWGVNSSFGADHMLNSQTYPLEMQIMYHLGPVTQELSSRKLLIIAFLFEVGNRNESLELIISNFCGVRQTGSRIKIEPFPLGAVIPLCEGGFYCYIGTMTLPPHYEGIKWLIYGKPLSLSAAQLAKFHKLLGANLEPIKQVKRIAHSL